MINLVFILIGIFLRINNISNDYYFTGESAKELLYAKHLIESNIFPTIGMATSHEWLYYGPIYYWILIPLVKIFNYNPFLLFWLSIAVSIAGIVVNYKLITKVANKSIAVYSTILISLSPIFTQEFSKRVGRAGDYNPLFPRHNRYESLCKWLRTKDQEGGSFRYFCQRRVY